MLEDDVDEKVKFQLAQVCEMCVVHVRENVVEKAKHFLHVVREVVGEILCCKKNKVNNVCSSLTINSKCILSRASKIVNNRNEMCLMTMAFRIIYARQ